MSRVDWDSPPTDAAKALDVLSLPMGTAVSWREDRGWGRGYRTCFGVVGKVTDKSYVLAGFLGDTARVPRSAEGVERRSLRALRTPEEEQARRDSAMARSQAEQEERERARVAEERDRLLSKVEKAARAELAQRHPEEYAEIKARLLAEAERPCSECGGVDYTSPQGDSSCGRCRGTGIEGVDGDRH